MGGVRTRMYSKWRRGVWCGPKGNSDPKPTYLMRRHSRDLGASNQHLIARAQSLLLPVSYPLTCCPSAKERCSMNPGSRATTSTLSIAVTRPTKLAVSVT